MAGKIEQIVLYKWKAGIGVDRPAYHLGEIRALVGKVDGLLSVRGGGKKFCYKYPKPGTAWDHGLVLTWVDEEALGLWGDAS